jgi:hypothetical protein
MSAAWRFIVVLMLLPICESGISAQEQPAFSDVTPPSIAADKDAVAPSDARESMCLLVESAARANHMPLEFSHVSFGRKAGSKLTRSAH